MFYINKCVCKIQIRLAINIFYLFRPPTNVNSPFCSVLSRTSTKIKDGRNISLDRLRAAEHAPLVSSALAEALFLAVVPVTNKRLNIQPASLIRAISKNNK